jgi:hypothetical protein
MMSMKPNSMRSVQTEISNIEIGTKSSIARGVMKKSGLRGEVQRVADLTKVRMVGTNAQVELGMKKMQAEGKKKNWGEVAFQDICFFECSNITVMPTGELLPEGYRHRSGSSGDGGSCSAFDTDDVSSMSSDSAGSFTHNLFRAALAIRDPDKCALCWSVGFLEAAHIYPKKGERLGTSFTDTGLTNRYCTQNGLLLCKPCHRFFDAGYWWIRLVEDVGYVAQLTEALQSYEQFGTYHNRVLDISVSGKEVPDVALLLVQEKYCVERRASRRKDRDENPWRCATCCKRWKKKKTLEEHSKTRCAVPDTPLLLTPPRPKMKKKRAAAKGK